MFTAIILGKSVQFGHLYRKLRNKNQTDLIFRKIIEFFFKKILRRQSLSLSLFAKPVP